jgi:hypothetical protein
MTDVTQDRDLDGATCQPRMSRCCTSSPIGPAMEGWS